ncbi:hypothetical protein [Neobacillus sp. FSL H8-0543]|uniref:hypothetical protein n=1 Tax=Neobacillus sp. FSL H8-0543 TaxID=2954672 RepID=UPI003157F4C2
MKKFIISGLFALGLIAFIIPNVQAASLQGWEKINSDWYYYTSSNSTHNGWLFDGGHWYYLDSTGKMRTGWLQVGGKWYYLNDNTGAMRTGWLHRFRGDVWYYFDKSGAMQTGWVKSNSKWYFMDSNGKMKVEWVYDDDWYYLDSSGAMKSGWFFGRSWSGYTTGYLYAYPNGKVAYNEMVNDTYFVNEDRVWIPSKNLEKSYKPLKTAVEKNGARLAHHYGRGVTGDNPPTLLLMIVDDDNYQHAFSFSYTPSKEADFDFTSFTGLADSKYTSLFVDSAIALGCPLDKQSLTNLISQAISQGGTFTEGPVTITNRNLSIPQIAINW